MNTDDDKTTQQGYGQPANDPQSQQTQQQPQAQQGNAQPIGGNDSSTGSGTPLSSGSSTGEANFETGQAAYGNSGQADAETMTQSQNSSDMGQQADMGQAANANDTGEGMPLGTAGGGYGGSGETQSGGQSGSGFVGSSSDNSGEYHQSSAGDQDFAEQGQGAMNQDLMGSDDEDGDDYAGTTDIETERSQGRESDIEGSSL